MKNLLTDLNPEQIRAVTHKSGPLLIIAGAGTGKTTVVTKRIAWIIQQKLAKPEEVLALTFTEKAAVEMDERILELLPYGVLDFTATTFHSFCQEVLKDCGILGGISPDFQLLTQSQQVLFLKQNISEFELKLYKPISNPNKFLGALVKLFSRTKDENISPEDYYKLAKNYQLKAKSFPKDSELSEKANMICEEALAYKTYERLMYQNNYFDFGDLIVKTLWLLKNRPSVLSQLQIKYKYIFVDEFQDNNFAQTKLIYLLAKKYQNITVVGDDDQAIYRFRGAAISNMMEFLSHYSKAKKVVLKKNYRSTKEILSSAYKLITNNNPDRLEIKEKISKKLESSVSGNKPEFWHFSQGISEVEQIIESIISDIQKKKKHFNDFAILIRANSYADDFIALFKNNGIPYQFVGSRGLYDQEEIRELISYMKILANPDDNLALFHVAWARQFKIDKILLRRLTNLSRQKNISLFEIFKDINSQENIKLTENDFAGIKKIISLIQKHIELGASWPTSKILIDYIYASGIYNLIRSIKDYRSQEILENLELFFGKISEFERVSENKLIFDFIEFLSLIIEAGDNPPVFQSDKHEDAISIMTIHQAKGLEFDTVFVPCLVQGRFPSGTRHDQIPLPDELIKEILPKGNVHLQEERRLFYVAITRAKKNLYLSASDFYPGNKRAKKISPFIPETIEKNDLKDFTKLKRQSIFNEKKESDIPAKVKKAQPKMKLSPSALEAFSDCPKRYEYSYVFKIKTPSTQSLSFGDSIHNTLRDCYRFLMDGKKMPEKDIKKILKNNWVCDGYLNKTEIDRAYQKGLSAIKKILQTDSEIPLSIEKKFELKINDCCNLSGRIDKIIQYNNYLEIIDYKTGDSRKKNPSEITKNLPLWIYALAIGEKNKISKIKLTLHYVLENKKISRDISEKKLAEKKEKIYSLCTEIFNASQTRNYPATPSKFSCGYCSYKSICPYKYKNV